MFTQHTRRQKIPQYIEMKPIKALTQQQKLIKQTQAFLKACFENAKSLKFIIMKSSLRNIKQNLDQYQKQLSLFNQVQRKLMGMQLEEQRQRIHKEVRNMQENLKNYQNQLTHKFKKDKNSQNQPHQLPNLMNNQLQLQQTISGDSLRTRLLDEQQQQITFIQKKMHTIKQLTLSSAQLVFGQGIKLNIAQNNIKNGVVSIQQANKQLIKVNQYEQDTSKVRPVIFCLVFVILIVLLLMYSAANK